ncbi:MAG: purine-nucleoside phosphorylase [Deltaproteobacteria bacterium]|jgi:purine-nucleoside phosphorylase|nr:purine-nucleoside phosphorylase [Deltaproteobacteria bacterium]MBW2530818.1 purine-nucleoside phosphorylase [Deltaproteobacteria bacterium]
MDLDVQLDEACRLIRERCADPPLVGVVLGSGLGAFADSLTDAVRIPYDDIPHMPTTTVVGHAGQLCVGRLGDVAVACLQGRVHMYEGHPPDRVVFGVRMLARLGCRAVQLTNAAGGLRETFRPGTLMHITDHLNLMGRNPLCGANHDFLGPRFPDMTRAYDREFVVMAREAAAEAGVDLAEGVYAALLGPSYETPAEIQMLRVLGADAVGMSTVPEVIALRHAGVRVSAVSCITNMAAGISGEELDHSEVERTANATRDAFVKLLGGLVLRISRAVVNAAEGSEGQS